ncbi:hypothetical protein T08_13335 [Trichinella sp. T8]|nr:hypothetical protein T08_13335 [Trichinella sp. T8]
MSSKTTAQRNRNNVDNTGWLETICLENGTATSRSDSTNSTI